MGFGSWKIIQKKGYPSFGWFFLGFFLGLFGLIIVLCMADKNPKTINGYPVMQQPQNYQMWYCPFCGQMNPSQAAMCACGTPRPAPMPMDQQQYYQTPPMDQQQYYQAPSYDPNLTPYQNQCMAQNPTTNQTGH